MANLSSLVHELRERIAASSSTPPNIRNDDALEVRFRAVLPNLLNAYVVPSSSAKEREVFAVLKLIAHTAKSFPGVFYHGKADSVLPVIGRILPFLAEPAFRSRNVAVIETIGALLSTLRTGDRDAYRQFFMDMLSVVEDLLYVASLCDKPSSTEPREVLLRCFSGSFCGGWSKHDTTISSDGNGILINVKGKERWQPFASSTIKILCKCLTEGTLYVEGLLETSSVLSACTLLCYGDADVHMACFDFLRIVGASMNHEIIPAERLIQLITTILCGDDDGLPIFRNTAYDSSIGGCLHVLYSSCHDDIVRSTSANFVNIFSHSLLKTRSLELKDALCLAYTRIAKICPPHSWRPESLIDLLYSSTPIMPLVECFQVALSRLFPNLSGGKIVDNGGTGLSNMHESPRPVEKRPGEDLEIPSAKHQKIDDENRYSIKYEDVIKHRYGFGSLGEKQYADHMHSSLTLFIQLLKPASLESSSLGPEVALTALSTLCIVFCRYPHTELSVQIFHLMYEWVPWVYEQAKQKSPVPVDVHFFLEAIHNLLIIDGKCQIYANSFCTLSNYSLLIT